jgi:hypothetical protein
MDAGRRRTAYLGKGVVLVGIAGAACVLAVGAVLSQVSAPPASSAGGPQLSAAERSARDVVARNDLAAVKERSPYPTRLPSGPPAGYLYDRVIWDPARPEQGFSIWMRRPGDERQWIHMIESPAIPADPKNTLRRPELTAVELQNGRWMAMRKPDAPWRGLWIFAAVRDGVQIEVDGTDRSAVEVVAGAL